MSNQNAAAVHRRRQSVSANIIRACKACGAPGVFRNEDWVKEKWPRCWVGKKNQNLGQPVGDVCPHCNASRAPGLIERLGEIWHQYL